MFDESPDLPYEQALADEGMTPQSFARDYPVRIHVRPTRLRAS